MGDLSGQSISHPARAWLAQQTAAGILTRDEVTGRFSLPPAHAAVLADPDSPAHLVGGALLAAGWFHGIDRVVEAFRTGSGIPWSHQHPDVFDGTERFFTPGYTMSLTAEWIPAVDGLVETLHTGGTIADVGCGHGTSTVLLAQAFPRATVIGYDAHRPSLEVARKRAASAGVAERVRFEVADAAGYPGLGFDLVCLLDSLHDLGDPQAAATRAYTALRRGGAVLVVEPQAADDLAENLANPLAALSYTASAFQCTPASLAQPGAAAWGAQAGERPVRAVLESAGFTGFARVADTPANAVYAARCT
ncbi:MAG: class I SAM-dependent methyltransferase [Pseudonocardia sp.]|nr:class I SAM-dependent methyltransferase [Pseudonocardia sp.]